MKNTIYKFKLELTDIQELPMHQGARVISAQEQGGELTIWALMNLDNPLRQKSLQVIGTGNPIQYNVSYHDWDFVSTVQMSNGLVWHVFADRG